MHQVEGDILLYKINNLPNTTQHKKKFWSNRYNDLEFTEPCWSATWNLLQLANFRGGEGGIMLIVIVYKHVCLQTGLHCILFATQSTLKWSFATMHKQMCR